MTASDIGLPWMIQEEVEHVLQLVAIVFVERNLEIFEKMEPRRLEP